jgi:hypothetical protein
MVKISMLLGSFAVAQAGYVLQTSGKCAMPITSSADCAKAAAAIRLSDRSVSDDRQNGVSYDPKGCYYESNSLKYNSRNTNRGSCTTYDKCLCKTATPVAWPKMSLQHCAGSKAVSTGYSSKASAQAACAKNSKCSGIYDPSCDARGTWYQCNYSKYLRSSYSCVYKKTPTAVLPAPVYKLQTSGRCTNPITSSASCAAAAKQLNLSDKTVSDDGQHYGVSYDPKGCYFENRSLKYNSKHKNTGACTTSDQCLCAISAPKKYTLQTQGRCRYPIISSASCAAAAKELNLSDKTVSDDGQHYGVSYDPKGCYFENRSLKYNSKHKNTGACTTSDQCLCGISAPYTPPPVNCVAKYGNWGKCTRQCGPGRQYRTRTITTPASNGGSNSACAGSTARDCNVKPCAINCIGSWGAWGVCDKACGGGAQTRKFRVSTPPSFGGTACPTDKGKPCNTQACCPVVRCPAPERGCTYLPSAELNANGCIKHPCGVKKCEKVCSHTKCSFIELPHKVGEQAVSIMQVVHNNKENMCSRHETVSKGKYIARASQVHCAKVNDKTHADYGKCKCHKLGFHPNGTPVNNAAGSFAGSAAVHGDGTKAGQGLITEADYNTALASHQQNGYNVDASTRDGTDYAAHDGRVY